jgi:hypothetical protein
LQDLRQWKATFLLIKPSIQCNVILENIKGVLGMVIFREATKEVRKLVGMFMSARRENKARLRQ